MLDIDIIAPQSTETTAALEHYELVLLDEIRAMNANMLAHKYRIGAAFLEVQKLLPKGAFMRWCENKIPLMSETTIRNVMQLAQAFTPQQIESAATMNASAAYVLAHADSSELIDLAIAKVAAGVDFTQQEAREMVQYHKKVSEPDPILELPPTPVNPDPDPISRTPNPDALELLRETHPELHQILTADHDDIRTELNLEKVLVGLEVIKHLGLLMMMAAHYNTRQFRNFECPNEGWLKLGLLDDDKKPTKKLVAVAVQFRELSRILDVEV